MVDPVCQVGGELPHLPVMLTSVEQYLLGPLDGYYVDATFGAGGHTRHLLNRLSKQGRMLAIDRDPSVAKYAEPLMKKDPRLTWQQGLFSEVLTSLPSQSVDGVLFDLGVSSMQLDQTNRGFSFSHDGPLDMRMDPDTGVSAAQWIATVDESTLIHVLKTYGEERFARRIAKAIIRSRCQSPITRTHQLAQIITKAHPHWPPHKHPATQSFQAIRIHINQELQQLHLALETALMTLKPGGCLLVISFHSLEDRVVKQFIRQQACGDEWPSWIPIQADLIKPRLKVVSVHKPSASEIASNPRSRSAILRVAQKLS